MSSVLIKRDVELAIEECCNCGVLFGMTARFQQECRNDGRWFYCPNGHKQHYSLSEIDRLKGELAQAAKNVEMAEMRARQSRERADAIDRSRSAMKGVITRERKRIANGVCPCCNRTFTNLHKHMSSQHPGYSEDAE